jgi:asparagine synthase (glutamine-hydrolysing)
VPGLSFICDLDRGVEALLPRVHAALDAARHDDTYGWSVLHCEHLWLLAASAYPQYPVASFDLGDVVVHREGRLYGPPSEAEALQRVARMLFESEAAEERIARWLRDTDGEFVLVAVQRSTGRLAILNDLLGRLPLYCRRLPGGVLLSRELRVITRLLPAIRFDPMGMAQFLLLGFPLGDRTLLDGVDRVAPATCVRIDPQRREIRASRVDTLDLGQRTAPARNTGELAHELAQRFAAACQARAASGGEHVVSLSGGADARSVAACLHRLDVPFRCATFLDADGAAAADVAVARRLATVFGAPWELFRLPPPGAADHLRLLRHKGGLNPLSMAYLLPYLAQLARRFGSHIVFFTGDGGDKVLPDLRPAAPAADADEAAAALLRSHALLPLDQVGALTGVRCADIVAELCDRLNAYPEAGWADRHVHFEICERAFKWLFEGEDRNRGFFWSTAPFYAAPFFLAAMQGDRGHKAHRALYRHFLLELSPAAAAVEYAGVDAPIDSAAFRTAAKAVALLAEAMHRRPAPPPPPAASNGTRASAALDGIRRQLARGAAVAEHLAPDHLAAFLDGPAARLPGAADTVFTLTSVIEDLAASDYTPGNP